MPEIEKSQFNHSITLPQEYLLINSQCIEQINSFYEQQQMPSLTKQYKNYLTTIFKNLNEHFLLFENDSVMKSAAVINCKMELDMFLLDKLIFLLMKETEPIGKILLECLKNYKENIEDSQALLLIERKQKVDKNEQGSNKAIQQLKKQILIKREYVRDLEQRVKELEEENMQIYQKIIGNAKTAIDHTLMGPNSSSKYQSNSRQIEGNPLSSKELTKLKNDLDHSHKTLSLKQVEEMILDIMDSKKKRESIKQDAKATSMNGYLKTYFRYKFGMKNLAEETEVNFKDALLFFAKTHQKSSIILFQKILDEQCEESYHWEHRSFHEKLLKQIKRYVNERQKIPFETLDRIYDIKAIDEKSDVYFNETDIKYVLINVYKSKEIDTLQMIFNEIMSKNLSQESDSAQRPQFRQTPPEHMLPSKRLINQLLNYELKKHLIKMEDVIHEIKKRQNGELFSLINFADMQEIALVVNMSEEKLEQFLKNYDSWRDKQFTFSQAVETIQGLRKGKINGNTFNGTGTLRK